MAIRLAYNAPLASLLPVMVHMYSTFYAQSHFQTLSVIGQYMKLVAYFQKEDPRLNLESASSAAVSLDHYMRHLLTDTGRGAKYDCCYMMLTDKLTAEFEQATFLLSALDIAWLHAYDTLLSYDIEFIIIGYVLDPNIYCHVTQYRHQPYVSSWNEFKQYLAMVGVDHTKYSRQQLLTLLFDSEIGRTLRNPGEKKDIKNKNELIKWWGSISNDFLVMQEDQDGYIMPLSYQPYEPPPAASALADPNHANAPPKYEPTVDVVVSRFMQRYNERKQQIKTEYERRRRVAEKDFQDAMKHISEAEGKSLETLDAQFLSWVNAGPSKPSNHNAVSSAKKEVSWLDWVRGR